MYVKKSNFAILTESTTYTVPKTGYYNIELHGKGGSGTRRSFDSNTKQVSCGGGGSGQLCSNILLQKDETYAVTIGNSVFFGSYTVAKGGDADIKSYTNYSVGVGSGDLAEDGKEKTSETTVSTLVASGGSGGSSIGNYGDGGEGKYADGTTAGEPGAVIITYVGESV